MHFIPADRSGTSEVKQAVFCYCTFLLLLLSGCSVSDKEVIFDFYDNLSVARIESVRHDVEQVRRSSLNLKKDVRDFIIQPAGTRIIYYVHLPAHSELRFGVGMEMIDWEKTGGIDLEISISTTSLEQKKLFSFHLDPLKNSYQWGWVDRTIDLSHYADQLVRFEFNSSCRADPEDKSKAGWAHARIVSTPGFRSVLTKILHRALKRGPARGPDIIWLTMANQLSRDVGGYGNSTAHTPFLDRLSKTTLTFQHALTPSFIGFKSVAAMLTGRFSTSHGINKSDARYRRNVNTLAEIMRSVNDCRSLFWTNTSLTESIFNLSADFDDNIYLPPTNDGDYSALQENSDHLIADIDYWLGQKGTPFFLYIYKDNTVKQLKITGPFTEDQKFPNLSGDISAGSDNEAGNISHGAALNDHDLGKILLFLERRNVLDSSIVIANGISHPSFSADETSEQPMLTYGDSETAMIIKFPGRFTKPAIITEAVSAVDIVPTIHDFLALSKQNCYDGRSFLPFVFPFPQRSTERGPLTIDNLPHSGCLVFQNIKMNYFKSGDDHSVAFYDLERDPYENNPLRVAENSFVLHRLKQQFLAVQKESAQ